MLRRRLLSTTACLLLGLNCGSLLSLFFLVLLTYQIPIIVTFGSQPDCMSTVRESSAPTPLAQSSKPSTFSCMLVFSYNAPNIEYIYVG